MMKNNFKNWIVMAVIALMASPFYSQAQTQDDGQELKTLFGNSNRKHSNGGYGGFSTAYTKIGGKDAIMFGGQGGWIIDHSVVLGAAGYGFMTERHFDNELNDNYMVAGGYGGLMVEFILAPQSPVHLSIPLVIGAGGIDYVRNTRHFDSAAWSEDRQAFFVIEPGLDLELNIVKFMRLAVGAKYRYTSDIELNYLDSEMPIVEKDAMRGFTTHITLKFGKF